MYSLLLNILGKTLNLDEERASATYFLKRRTGAVAVYANCCECSLRFVCRYAGAVVAKVVQLDTKWYKHATCAYMYVQYV